MEDSDTEENVGLGETGFGTGKVQIGTPSSNHLLAVWPYGYDHQLLCVSSKMAVMVALMSWFGGSWKD